MSYIDLVNDYVRCDIPFVPPHHNHPHSSNLDLHNDVKWHEFKVESKFGLVEKVVCCFDELQVPLLISQCNLTDEFYFVCIIKLFQNIGKLVLFLAWYDCFKGFVTNTIPT
jgi:hypothetical protein